MTPIEAINKEYNNRFTIITLFDERTMGPIYEITDTLTNKVKTIPLPLSLTQEAIYNLLIESINNIISLNRNINIESILR